MSDNSEVTDKYPSLVISGYIYSVMGEPLTAAHHMIQIAKPWTIRRWSESKLANGKPLVWIPKENAHLVDLKWTEDEQAKLKTIIERYTSQGASGAWRVHRWRLACFSLVLGDTENRNDVSGQWYDEWPLDT